MLSDTGKRALYDEFGEISLTQGFDPDRARAYQQAQARAAEARAHRSSFVDFDVGVDDEDIGDPRQTQFDDFLSRLFGGGRVRTERRDAGRARGKGSDIAGEIAVSLLDALHGVTVPVRIEGDNGEGRTLDVKVPQGIADGGKLRLRGQGGSGIRRATCCSPCGCAPSPRLGARRQRSAHGGAGTAFEAYRGGPIDVRTPWGRSASSYRPGSQNGQTLRLRGHGVRRPAASRPAICW